MLCTNGEILSISVLAICHLWLGKELVMVFEAFGDLGHGIIIAPL